MASKDFLNACPPPWKAFPEIAAEDLGAYLTQGTTEWWFDQCFRPFWNGLTEAQRQRYLDRWCATGAWRTALEIFAREPDLDLAGDATESEEYMQRWRERRPGMPPWWRRWFRAR